MAKLTVDTELLKSLLGAAYSTYMGHRGQSDELYALGALEATANVIYVLSCNNDNEELENMSQQFAADALNRASEIAEFMRTNESETHSEDKIASLFPKQG